MLGRTPPDPEPAVTDPSLQRIAATLARLAEEQSELAKRIARLESQSREPRALDGSPRERVIAFLDQFRAGEVLSELSLGAWIAVCKDSELRGALRIVQAREAGHARLLGERIKELGGASRYEIPEPTYTQVMTGSASLEIDDAEKVRAFVARNSDPVVALASVHAMADRLDDDRETQALLRAIAQDELATLELFYAAAQRMERD
jgi:hypothetical protein